MRNALAVIAGPDGMCGCVSCGQPESILSTLKQVIIKICMLYKGFNYHKVPGASPWQHCACRKDEAAPLQRQRQQRRTQDIKRKDNCIGARKIGKKYLTDEHLHFASQGFLHAHTTPCLEIKTVALGSSCQSELLHLHLKIFFSSFFWLYCLSYYGYEWVRPLLSPWKTSSEQLA